MEDRFLTYSLLIINSSYDRLESIVLVGIESEKLHLLLTHYTRLPRLFSLNINTEYNYTLGELNNTYQSVFALKKLKSLILETDIFDRHQSIFSLSIVTNQQFSSMKTLYINHSVSIKKLFTIMSYTPQLCRLKLSYASDDDEQYIENVLPISLLNLIHFSIDEYVTSYDKFRWFIKNVLICKLKVLYLAIDDEENITWLDANHWEQLIRQYLPQLKKFHLEYVERIADEQKILNNSGQLNQFFSTFWIERQLILEIEIENNDHFKYIIRPYRKQWYEYIQDNIINSSVQLILKGFHYCADVPLLKSYIDRILIIGQIYHLEISGVYINEFIQIINLLPKLDTLKISSLWFKESKCLSIDEIELINLISNKNKITKVNLEKIKNIKEVCLLLELCPPMTHLKVDFINNIDIELFVRIILLKIKTKCNHQLRLLCFYIQAADDQVIQTLKTMICFEKLLLDYTIKRIQDNIYLEWK